MNIINLLKISIAKGCDANKLMTEFPAKAWKWKKTTVEDFVD